MIRSTAEHDHFRVGDHTAECFSGFLRAEVLHPLTAENTGSRRPRTTLCEDGVLARGVIMETSALPQSASDRYSKAAGPIHTIFVLAVLGGWTFWGKVLADQLRAAANPNRLRFNVL